jgi:quinol monooxygenase YgiN
MTIYNNVLLTVSSLEDVNTVATKLTSLASASMLEPGCERFEVYHSETESKVFMLIEQWQSQQALDQHREATAFQSIYLPDVIPLVTRSPHLCRLLTEGRGNLG